MIYIEEKLFDRQIDLLEYLSLHGEFDLIIWFFPESKLRSICDLKLAPKGLIEGEQITTYGDGFKPKKTRRVGFTSDLIAKIRESADDIRTNCDSLILYHPGETKWFVCTIEHEGMCLISDENVLNTLVTGGFNASLEKPEWW